MKRPTWGGPVVYGCVLRPSAARVRRAPRRDLYLEQVIDAVGGEVVDYDGSRKCCGFPVITMNRETSLTQAGTHVGDAISSGADCWSRPASAI